MEIKTRYVLLFFLILSVIAFRSYFFKGLVPIQFNLLPSFYSPWKYISWPGYPSGVPNKPIGTDNPKLFYPYRKFTVDELKRGRIPLWNPYVFSGNIHAATYQSAVYYPLNILYFVLPLADAWSILVIIQPILAGFFTFLFLKSQRMTDRGSLFGALCFAFSGWMIAWWEESLVIEHSILWLPLALYASSLLWQQDKKQALGFILFFTAISMSILAGFLQMTLYLGITVALWNFYLWVSHPKRSLKPAALLFVGALLAMCITAIHWFPAFEAYRTSPRGAVAATFLFEEFLVPLKHLVTFLAPDFWGNPGTYNYFFPRIFYHEKVVYIGIVPLLFALYAFFKGKGTTITFWKILTLVTLSLGFALPTSWIWHILRVPILSVANPSRIFVLAAFGFSILAAYGIDAYWETRKVRKIAIPILVMTVAFISLWVFVASMIIVSRFYPDLLNRCFSSGSEYLYTCNWLITSKISSWSLAYASISLRNLIVPTALVLLTIVSLAFFSKKQKVLYGILVAITFIGNMYFAQKFLYFSDRRFEFPEVKPIQKLKELAGYSRVWSYGNAYIEKNIQSYFGLYSVEGYDALFSQQYGELLYTIKNGGMITDQIHRTDVDLKQAAEVESLGDNTTRLRLLSLLGVKYILETKLGENKSKTSTEKRFPPELFTLAWEDDAWRIWEYTSAMPRVWFTGSLRVEKDPQRIVDTIFDKQTDYNKVAIVEEIPDELKYLPELPEESTLPKALVRILDYQPTSVTIEVNTPSPGIVILSDTFFPGWTARIDGEPNRIYRAYYTLRGIPVRDGLHRITLIYEPITFQIGVLITAAGILFSFGLWWYVLRKGKVNKWRA